MSLRARIAQKNADLTVLDPSGRAAVLARDPGRMAPPFFKNPRPVQNQDAGWIAEIAPSHNPGRCREPSLDPIESSHIVRPNSAGIRHGAGSPAYSANCQPFLRSAPPMRPSRRRPTRRRGSARRKNTDQPAPSGPPIPQTKEATHQTIPIPTSTPSTELRISRSAPHKNYNCSTRVQTY